eukprot:SAG31_NODE_3984_length_3686_cov_2.132980_1_plen_48_part_10
MALLSDEQEAKDSSPAKSEGRFVISAKIWSRRAIDPRACEKKKKQWLG